MLNCMDQPHTNKQNMAKKGNRNYHFSVMGMQNSCCINLLCLSMEVGLIHVYVSIYIMHCNQLAQNSGPLIMHCIHGLQVVLNSVKVSASCIPTCFNCNGRFCLWVMGEACMVEVNVEGGTIHLSQPHWLQLAE